MGASGWRQKARLWLDLSVPTAHYERRSSFRGYDNGGWFIASRVSSARRLSLGFMSKKEKRKQEEIPLTWASTSFREAKWDLLSNPTPLCESRLSYNKLKRVEIWDIKLHRCSMNRHIHQNTHDIRCFSSFWRFSCDKSLLYAFNVCASFRLLILYSAKSSSEAQNFFPLSLATSSGWQTLVKWARMHERHKFN